MFLSRAVCERPTYVSKGVDPAHFLGGHTVARCRPPGSITFDMVVFDEASQIKVAESIGALGLARSVIVVGDTRQMPPSQFGGRSAPDPDVEPDTDEESVLEDLECILSECVESNLQRLYLECHYRSRHEALISFSNHHFYENRLTTFPSPLGPMQHRSTGIGLTATSAAPARANSFAPMSLRRKRSSPTSSDASTTPRPLTRTSGWSP